MRNIDLKYFGFKERKSLFIANDLTEAEFIELLRSRYSCSYDLRFTRTDKQLIVLFLDKECLSHVAAYDVKHFKIL